MNEPVERKIFIYKDIEGTISVKAFMHNGTLWLTQKAMAELFDCSIDNISLHLKNIFETGELNKNSVTEKNSVTASDGKNYLTQFYNLDAIISVGYRVNSVKATSFRIWATNVLREYIVKGFALDDERLKGGKQFDKAHFRELLDRIKDIRTSERMLYQQLKDIYALSEDYSRNNADSLIFFAQVQDKVHFAITGQTAAEIVYKMADAQKDNMGLTTWKNAPDGKFTKQETVIAKNYLNASEMEGLKDIVNMFLDYAEMQAKAQTPIFIHDWIDELDNFLKFMKKPVLSERKKYSHAQAVRKAYAEYEKYKLKQKAIEKEQAQQEYIEDIKELNFILEHNKNKI